MPVHDKDRAIDSLARRQHGVFHRRQAVRAGFTRRMIDRRLASGVWSRLLKSEVYAVRASPGTWLRQCMAATLAVPGAAAAGRAAAALLAFPGWPRAHIEVAVRSGTTNRSPFGPVRQTDTVGRLVVVEGIRVVSPADCLVQLAAELDARQLGMLADAVAHDRRRLLDELRDRYARLAHSRVAGIGTIRAVVEARGEGYVRRRASSSGGSERSWRPCPVCRPSSGRRHRHGSNVVAVGSTPSFPTGVSSSRATAALWQHAGRRHRTRPVA